MIFHGDLLHAQVLFPGNGKPGPGFYGLIIRYYYTLPVADIADTGYRAACRAPSLFFIHVIAGKSADLNERAVFVDEVIDALSCGEFILLPLFVDRFFPSPQCNLVQPDSHLAERPLHRIFIFVEIYIHGHAIYNVWKRLRRFSANAGTVDCPPFGSNDGPMGKTPPAFYRSQFNTDDLIFGVFLKLCSVKTR